MASLYDVVCLNCGEVYYWCKYYPPYEKCSFCRVRLSSRGEWSENARVYGVGSTSPDILETSKTIRLRFFKEKGRVRFKTANGLWCTVKLKEYPAFWFHFRVDGERISLLYDGRKGLSEIVEALKEHGRAPREQLIAAYYRRYYMLNHPAVEAILIAIEEKVKPS